MSTCRNKAGARKRIPRTGSSGPGVLSSSDTLAGFVAQSVGASGFERTLCPWCADPLKVSPRWSVGIRVLARRRSGPRGVCNRSQNPKTQLAYCACASQARTARAVTSSEGPAPPAGACRRPGISTHVPRTAVAPAGRLSLLPGEQPRRLSATRRNTNRPGDVPARNRCFQARRTSCRFQAAVTGWHQPPRPRLSRPTRRRRRRPLAALLEGCQQETQWSHMRQCMSYLHQPLTYKDQQASRGTTSNFPGGGTLMFRSRRTSSAHG